MHKTVAVCVTPVHLSPRRPMGYTRFVEIGRVALVNYGEQYGKLCVIMDVLDHNRVSRMPSHAADATLLSLACAAWPP